jgi:hypothetical protein
MMQDRRDGLEKNVYDKGSTFTCHDTFTSDDKYCQSLTFNISVRALLCCLAQAACLQGLYKL